jgi:hypothetical protein
MNKYSMVDRMALRLFRAFTRLPLAAGGEADSAGYRVDNPALRFRQLQARAGQEIARLEAAAQFWGKFHGLLGRLATGALVLSLIGFLLAGQSLRKDVSKWLAHRNVDAQTTAAVPVATVMVTPSKGFQLPTWKVTLPVSLVSALVWYGTRAVRLRISGRVGVAFRKRDDFRAFMLRRRHITPLEEDCDILELQLERQVVAQKRSVQTRRPVIHEGYRGQTETGGSFFASLREKIALW